MYWCICCYGADSFVSKRPELIQSTPGHIETVKVTQVFTNSDPHVQAVQTSEVCSEDLTSGCAIFVFPCWQGVKLGIELSISAEELHLFSCHML